MQILLNIDDLRQMAVLSANVAEKMDNANTVMTKIVSKHDWKCPERNSIDETIERLKKNSVALSEAFNSFSDSLITLANGFTDFTILRDREEVTYMDDVMSRMVSFTSGTLTNNVSSGENISSVVSDLELSSNDLSNITSLHGVTHGINIVDFSLFDS